MPRFRFEAMGSSGETESGHIQAADAKNAGRLLRQRGLFVTTLAEAADEEPSDSSAASSDSPASRAEHASRSLPRPGRWLGAVVIVVGLVTFGAGFYGVIESVWFQTGTERATAVVVDREWTGGTNFYDILGFTAGGHEHRVPKRGCFGVRSGRPDFSGLGVRWEVLYPPDHPEQARIAGFNRNFGGPLIFLVLGLLFAPAGVLVMRRGLKWSRE